jgi:23S rRNA-/tRNA-specific pseudouridylate synthase
MNYWTHAISCGHIRINNKKTKEDYIIKNGDRLLHRTHRHEPSVVGAVSLVAETDDIVAVSKPASMPSRVPLLDGMSLTLVCSASLRKLQVQHIDLSPDLRTCCEQSTHVVHNSSIG